MYKKLLNKVGMFVYFLTVKQNCRIPCTCILSRQISKKCPDVQIVCNCSPKGFLLSQKVTIVNKSMIHVHVYSYKLSYGNSKYVGDTPNQKVTMSNFQHVAPL